MKTVREVTRIEIIEKDEQIRERPEFKIGEYAEVYFGEYEGHNFTIKDLRYNHNRNMFEYLYGSYVNQWFGENQIVAG